MFQENRLNGSRLLKLTERMAELLVPIIGDRIVLLEELEKLRGKENSTEDDQHTTSVDGKNAGVSDENKPEDAEAAAGPGPSSSTSVVWHDLHDYK